MPKRVVDIRFDSIDPESIEAVQAMEAYFAELESRFPTGFDPGDPKAEADHYRRPVGEFVIGSIDGAVVGCGAVQMIDASVGEVKRMWVNPDHRGLGVGRSTLVYLETVASELGATLVRLDTNAVLTEAVAMYLSSGYVEIDRYNDNPYAQRWFEKPL